MFYSVCVICIQLFNVNQLPHATYAVKKLIFIDHPHLSESGGFRGFLLLVVFLRGIL